MPDAVIVEAVRSPIGKGKPGGALSAVHPVDLHAFALRGLVDRVGLDPAVIDDVIGGTVGQIGEQSLNTTRWAVLAAGFPESVPGVTIDRQCGSSQQAVHFAAQGILSGWYEIVVASGVESMSRIPIGSQAAGKDPFGPSVAKRYLEGLVPQGISAELIASKWKLSREQLDQFAVDSHRKASEAWSSGKFDREVLPLVLPGSEGATVTVTHDESVRPGTSLDVLADLRPAFASDAWVDRFPEIDWRVTAGNSSPVNDGAAAVLLMSDQAASRLNLAPRARLHSFAVVGDDPILMLMGIVPATRKVLERAGITLDQVDAFEVNEAFASVVLAWMAETGVDPAKVNINGGATAIGHPLGASGARLMCTLLSVLDQTGGRFGLQVMCEAGGLANATLVERL